MISYVPTGNLPNGVLVQVFASGQAGARTVSRCVRSLSPSRSLDIRNTLAFLRAHRAICLQSRTRAVVSVFRCFLPPGSVAAKDLLNKPPSLHRDLISPQYISDLRGIRQGPHQRTGPHQSWLLFPKDAAFFANSPWHCTLYIHDVLQAILVFGLRCMLV